MRSCNANTPKTDNVYYSVYYQRYFIISIKCSNLILNEKNPGREYLPAYNTQHSHVYTKGYLSFWDNNVFNPFHLHIIIRLKRYAFKRWKNFLSSIYCQAPLFPQQIVSRRAPSYINAVYVLRAMLYRVNECV